MTLHQTYVRKSRFRILPVLAQLAVGLAFSVPVLAATITVTTTLDVVNPTDGLCSLREAVIAANTNTPSGGIVGECNAGSVAPTVDQIVLGAQTYTLTITGPGEDAGASGDLDLTESATISGVSAASTIIRGNGVSWDDRILHVVATPATAAGVIVTINDLTVQDGKLSGTGVNTVLSGGAIYNQGTLTINNSVIKNSSLISAQATAQGGGISNEASLAINGSSISGNAANGASFNLTLGGGIYSQFPSQTTLTDSSIVGNSTTRAGGGAWCYGDCTFIRSTISGNTSADHAGGVAIVGATASMTNSTVSGNIGNSAFPAFGGGIMVDGVSSRLGVLTLDSSTIAGNSIPNGTAGGISMGSASSASISIRNTIIAGNSALNGIDCAGPFVSAGHNLIGNNSGCVFPAQTGDLIGTNATPINPLLSALANNGGATMTRALQAGSPAIDAGGNVCPATDQRGNARPAGSNCDIGAFELGAAAVAPAFMNGPPPAGTPGVAYNFVYAASGSGIKTFAVTAGALPTGLTLASDGTISGTPTVSGAFNGTVTVSNGTAPDASQAFSITIAAAVAPGVAAIPTLGEWALALLALLIGVLAVRSLPARAKF